MENWEYTLLVYFLSAAVVSPLLHTEAPLVAERSVARTVLHNLLDHSLCSARTRLSINYSVTTYRTAFPVPQYSRYQRRRFPCIDGVYIDTVYRSCHTLYYRLYDELI